jgi:hypothetical protein
MHHEFISGVQGDACLAANGSCLEHHEIWAAEDWVLLNDNALVHQSLLV